MQLGIDSGDTKGGVCWASWWGTEGVLGFFVGCWICLHGACAAHTSLLLGSLWNEAHRIAIWDALSL